MTARDLLIYLSLKHNGNWDSICHAIKTHEHFDIESVEASVKYAEEELAILAKTHCAITTLVDDDYPTTLKYVTRPPFVLYRKDNITVTKPFKGLWKPEASPKA